MNSLNKEDNTSICKTHIGRSDRAEFRICPSKLSKKELEDLYFTLLENNLDLKKTINIQQDKIKVLSNKLQRMIMLQKSSSTKESKDGCANTKLLISEQQESILNLKRANERMTERIRVLNMRLCSARQFSRNSTAAPSPCPRCAALAATGRNSFVSVSTTKPSANNSKEAASQYTVNEIIASKASDGTNEDHEHKTPEKLYDDNKYSILMDELKQKIANLEQELSKTHEDYSERINRLEVEVVDVHSENQSMRCQCLSSDAGLRRSEGRAEELGRRLRTAEAHCGELEAQLTIERRKVSELATQVKALNMSRSVASVVDDHLANTNKKKNENGRQLQPMAISPAPNATQASSQEKPSTSVKPDAFTDTADQNDSGYTENNDEQKALSNLNDELSKRISILQSHLSALKSTASQIAEDVGVDADNVSETREIFEETNLAPANSLTSQAESAVAPPSCSKNPLKNSSCNQKNTTLPTKERKQDKRTSTTVFDRRASTVADRALQDRLDLTDEVKKMVAVNRESVDENKAENQRESLLETDLEKLPAYKDSVTEKDVSQLMKTEYRESYQFPDPLPVDKNARKTMRQNDLISSFKFKQQAGTDKRKENRTSDESQKFSRRGSVAAPNRDNNKKDTIANSNVAGNTTVETKRDLDKASVRSINFEDKSTYVPPNNSYWKNEEEKTETKSLECSPQLTPTNAQCKDQGCNVDEAEFKQIGQTFEVCSEYARVCSCPAGQRRTVSVFRTCSGSLRFTTACDKSTLKQCGCDDAGTLRNFGIQTEAVPSKPQSEAAEAPVVRHRSVTYSNMDEYAILPQQSRSTSPENTDHEIYSLPDLPEEKEAKSQQTRTLSPGEHKATTTYTDSSTACTTDYGSLSVGELPAAGAKDTQSIGETKVNFASVPSLASQRMEAALQAIGEELARCRELLMSQRSETQSVICECDCGCSVANQVPSPE